MQPPSDDSEHVSGGHHSHQHNSAHVVDDGDSALPLLSLSGVTLLPPTAETPVVTNIAMDVRRGRTTAVLGLSGCGKTVLLQLIAGRLHLPSFGFSGSIAIHANDSTPSTTAAGWTGDSTISDDGKRAEQVLNTLRPRVSYVPPDDVIFGFDTPREAIVFRHRLAFGSSHDEASQAANRLLVELGLEQCADNLIAPGVGLRGISGGQRRRTCIAMALVTEPDLLVLDEPTTGLDSTTAKQVMGAVQALARTYGCAVVQSLQQPGSDLFPHFDDLVMLRADGSLEYAGPTLKGPDSVPKSHARFAGMTPPLSARSPAAGQRAVTMEESSSPNSPPAGSAVPPLGPPAAAAGNAPQRKAVGSVSIAFVTFLVIQRHYRAVLRNPLALLMRVVQSVVLGIFFGVIYYDMAMTSDNFKQIIGFMLVFTSAAFIPVQTGAAVFPLEKHVFEEEQRLPYRYPAAVYALSKFVTESTAQIPLSIIYALLMGGLMHLPGPSLGRLCLTAGLQAAAAEGFGFFISTVAPPEVSIAVITPVVAFIMMIVGTSLATDGNATDGVLDILRHLAFLRSSFAALAIDILALVKVPCSTGLCVFPDAQTAVVYYDLDHTTEGQEWGLLAMWAVVFRIASMIALSIMAAVDIVEYDARKHRRAPVPSGDNAVHVDDASPSHVRSEVRYSPHPSIAALRWDVKFVVRPRWGEGSDAPRTILNRMTGVAHGGRALAIMGGSGAGKSTLLEALSIRLPATNVFTETARETEISVQLKDERIIRDVPAEARSLIAFVHQDPTFVDTLTAFEITKFAVTVAQRDDSGSSADSLAHAILAQLGLEHAAEMPAGFMSGSQRKRLAVAVALAQRRPILMLDEPTSGLDPESALQLLRLLQELAHAEQLLVLYTLHQPGDELLQHIDDLLLLSAGRVLYHGPLSDADTAFGGYPQPPGLNATDHYLELSSMPKTSAELAAAWATRTSSGVMVGADHGGDGGVVNAPFAEAGDASSSCDAAAVASLKDAQGAEAAAVLAIHDGLGNIGGGFAALVRRSFTVTVLRASLPSLIGRFFTLNILFPFCVGFTMFDEASNIVGLRNGCFIYAMSLTFAASMIPLMDLHLERVIFLREQELGSYSPVAYFVARSLAGIPVDVAGLLIGANIVYWMVGLYADAGSYFVFLAVALILHQCSVSIGFLLGVLIHSVVVSAALGTLLLVVFATAAGVPADPDTMNDSKWMHGLEFLSPTRQAVVLFVQNDARHRQGGEFLVDNLLGFDRWFDEPLVAWFVLVAHFCLWRLLAAICFKLTTRPGSYGRSRGL